MSPVGRAGELNAAPPSPPSATPEAGAPPPPPPPVSLGRRSLRHRLESYYALICPAAVTADPDEWKRKFELILKKFGGSTAGEAKLASKLAGKYGGAVRLLVARSEKTARSRGGNGDGFATSSAANDGGRIDRRQQHPEGRYDLRDGQRNSHVSSFASPDFDPAHALLGASERDVAKANPGKAFAGASVATRLDNVSKFRALLPACDPQSLRRGAGGGASASAIATAKRRAEEAAKKKEGGGSNIKKVPLFLSLVSRYQRPRSGPLHMLYTALANRQRVRVMVRYVDCVRGTLTGYLVAFDKHYNMILRDADEVYSAGRISRCQGAVALATASGDDDGVAVASVADGGGGNDDEGGKRTQTQKADPHAKSGSGGDRRLRPPDPAAGSGPPGPRKPDLEARRRRCYPPDGSGGPGPPIKRRHFHQIMVRGDNVVMVWKAESERSAHPKTGKSPAGSMYTKEAAASGTGHGGGQVGVGGANRDGGGARPGGVLAKVGTPGSLYFALQRWENQRRPQRERDRTPVDGGDDGGGAARQQRRRLG